jgi:hypothetical protein
LDKPYAIQTFAVGTYSLHTVYPSPDPRLNICRTCDGQIRRRKAAEFGKMPPLAFPADFLNDPPAAKPLADIYARTFVRLEAR